LGAVENENGDWFREIDEERHYDERQQGFFEVVFFDLQDGAKSDEKQNEQKKKIADVAHHSPAQYDNWFRGEVIEIGLKHKAQKVGGDVDEQGAKESNNL